MLIRTRVLGLPMSKKILVVEDDNDSREALCTILEFLDYETISFGSPKEALEKLQEGSHDLDLALLDIMMPEMSGYELLEELKKNPSLKDIPYIMVTAKDQDSEILTGYKSGADYYITKPFTSEQIKYGLKLFLEPKES